MAASTVKPEHAFEIMQAYARYAEGLDSKNWALVRDCFADEVYIDYGSISEATGSPEVPRRADDWLQILQSVINGFDTTHHTISNFRFEADGQRIICRAYLVADHVVFSDPDSGVAAAEDVATVVGEYTNTYEATAEGWKICRSKLAMDYSLGNMALFATATERAAARSSS